MTSDFEDARTRVGNFLVDQDFRDRGTWTETFRVTGVGNVAGCLVNGAARADLSSEKVYVKLQRMTCPQPNGRYAVSEVKGFIAFGGKTGVRGRVVSRECALVGQAFLAGLFGGFGSFPVTLTSKASGKSEVYWK